LICCSALRRLQAWSDRTRESFTFYVRRCVSGRMLIALVTLLSRACARVVMSDSEDSLNDWTADDEPCRERLFNTKSIADCLGYRDASGIVVLQHTWCQWICATQGRTHCLLHLFQGRRITACPDKSQIIFSAFVVPATRKSDTAHSFLRGSSSQ
jgi:hypothetical protein